MTDLKRFATIAVFVLPLLMGAGACRQSGDDGSDQPEAVDPLRVDIAVFPADNAWNLDVSAYPVHPRSAAFVASIGADEELHPDFGTVWEGDPIGIPYRVVGAGQALVTVTYTAYADESDPGPFPIPDDAPVEAGSDHHVLVVDSRNRMLYELYKAVKVSGGWEAESGAKWNLDSNALRPKYWTSADAAGLPIFPGLVRYQEVETGEIRHALRFTVPRSQRGFIAPARHYASDSDDADLPPMGLRFRLKADVDIGRFSARVQVILRALQRYGMMVADNGSAWYLGGSPDSRWDDEDLHSLHQLHGRDFEAVYTGDIEH